MKNATLTALVVVAAAGTAHAQPDTDTTTTTPDPTVTSTTDAGTTSEVAPPVYATVPPPPAASVQAPAPKRPEAFAVGIGIGYDFPTDLQQPNITGVRFRLPSGLTFEPRVIFGFSTFKAGSSSTKSLELGLGTDVRFPRKLHGPVDLIFIGGAGIDRTSSNPPGSDNSTSSFAIDLHYGLGLEYWFSQHFSISATAENPVLTLLSTTTDTGPGTSDTTSTTTIAAEWAPNVFVFGHLYL
jgi:hypothetical protein